MSARLQTGVQISLAEDLGIRVVANKLWYLLLDVHSGSAGICRPIYGQVRFRHIDITSKKVLD
jgi:hypothetical protein